jgi:hypothetical protein
VHQSDEEEKRARRMPRDMHRPVVGALQRNAGGRRHQDARRHDGERYDQSRGCDGRPYRTQLIVRGWRARRTDDVEPAVPALAEPPINATLGPARLSSISVMASSRSVSTLSATPTVCAPHGLTDR